MTINTVYLHKAVMIPKTGHTENHLNQQKVPGIKMWLDGQFLWFTAKDTTCSTPITNIDVIWWNVDDTVTASSNSVIVRKGAAKLNAATGA